PLGGVLAGRQVDRLGRRRQNGEDLVHRRRAAGADAVGKPVATAHRRVFPQRRICRRLGGTERSGLEADSRRTVSVSRILGSWSLVGTTSFICSSLLAIQVPAQPIQFPSQPNSNRNPVFR